MTVTSRIDELLLLGLDEGGRRFAWAPVRLRDSGGAVALGTLTASGSVKAVEYLIINRRGDVLWRRPGRHGINLANGDQVGPLLDPGVPA